MTRPQLVWELDRVKTNLPLLFAIEEEYDGEIDRGSLREIEPRTQFSINRKLCVRIAEQDPRSFAQALSSLDRHSIVINYHTRRIDGESSPREVIIEGDFQGFRETCVPYIVDVAVGQYHVAIAIAIVGESRPTGQIDEKGSAIEIKTNDVRLCREHLWCREEDPQYTARDLVESVVKDYEKSTNVLLLEEMHSSFIDS